MEDAFAITKAYKKRISFTARRLKKHKINHLKNNWKSGALSSATSLAFNALSVTAALAVKWETAALIAGLAQRDFFFFLFFFFLVAPAFCGLLWKFVWFECRDLKQSLRDSAQSAPLCTEAACHLLTSVIRGFILWTLYCGSYSERHLPLNYIKTQGRGGRCRENKKRGDGWRGETRAAEN